MNVIKGTSGADMLIGSGGSDYIMGLGGADTVNAGAGNDVIYVSTAFASVLGGDGFDRFYLNGPDARTIDLAATEIEYVFGADGGDVFNAAGQTSRVVLFGNGGNDVLTGSAFNDVLYGGSGADTFDCGAGNDRVYTNTEFASVTGGAGYDHLILNGTTAMNLSLAALGFERVVSGGGDDVLDATGVARGSMIEGGRGNDTLTGGSYRDQLDGGFDNDVIDGGLAADTITGGAGRDIVTGGKAADRFVFGNGDFAGSTAALADRITDFRSTDKDIIDLTAVDAVSSTFQDEAFTFIGTSAFHSVAGELRFRQSGGNTFVEGDLDGNGAADFTICLTGLRTLSEVDFAL